MADRNLSALAPRAYRVFSDLITLCKSEGVDILVYCTYRSPEEQNVLYAQGRTSPGKKVTNARGGESLHQYRCAVDLVPLRAGKPIWDVFHHGVMEPEWLTLVTAAKSLGIEWAGDWVNFKEYVHFQFTGGITLKEFQKGKELS